MHTHDDGFLHFSAGNGYLSQDVHMRGSVRVLFLGLDISKSQQPDSNGQQQQPEQGPPPQQGKPR